MSNGVPVADSAEGRQVATLERDFEALARRVEAIEYTGYEFDDFLASPVLRRLSLGNLILQRIFVQVGERLPLNLRPLLGVKRLPSAKANGFFARGYLRAFMATGHKPWLARAKNRLGWLIENHVRGYAGLAWGNEFDFASRAGFFPRSLPTVVWTSHISRAFSLAGETLHDDRYAQAVASCADFILHDLERHKDRRGVCIAYAPGMLALVHNSNLLGAVALLRGWRLDRDPAKHEVAKRAFAWSLGHMNPDGSWYYGVGPKYRWIDNFHTGYIIDCLVEGHRLGGTDIVPSDAIDYTVSFWRERFFLSDGTPKYYDNRTYPLDIQCAAQAITTLADLGESEPSALHQAQSVLDWTKRRLRRRDGYYMYRRYRFFANRLVSIHWGQATMLEALGSLLHRSSTREGRR